MAVGHFDARHCTLFDHDSLHQRVREHLTARFLNLRDDALGNSPAAADGIETAVQIMSRDHRVHHERGLLRRQTHITPLTAERGDQVLVVGQLTQNVVGIAIKTIRRTPLDDRRRDAALPGLQGPLHAALAERAAHLFE